MSLDIRTFAAKVRVADGAWGTQLQQRGLPAGSPPEVWNVQSPSVVEAVARAYVQAGADVILTNSFGANRFVLGGIGAESRVAELAEAAARISKRAAIASRRPEGAKVFGSIGPTGQIVMMEQVPKERLSAAFKEAAEALSWGGADAIVLETFNELDEAMIALEAARAACDLPVILSMTFSSGPDKTCTMMGNKPADVAKAARRAGAAGVGANCGVGPANYVNVARMLREAADLPVWVKPNAGLPVMAPSGKTTFPMGPDEFAGYVGALVQAGANFVGGCCGTTPAHIAAVRKAVDGL
jgi:methionine synthase I (cobalamin-dependent)